LLSLDIVYGIDNFAIIYDMTEICGYSIDEYCNKVKEFHGGNLAPGLIIAGFMVELASSNMPENTLYEVICETAGCIPDAVQLLTPCTAGNQWMHILDVGRYAMSFYDKYSGEGVRVYLDSSKLEKWPTINEWFFRLKLKKEQNTQELLKKTIEAGPSILSIEPIKISSEFLVKKTKKSIFICQICKEAFPSEEETICPACRNDFLPYVT